MSSSMPKMKTHKGAAARFRVTGSGRIMRMYGSRNNHRLKKRKPVRVKLGRTVPVHATQHRSISRLLNS